MSDTKCQFQGTETPPHPPLNCICKAEGSKEEYGDYYHVSEFQRGRWRKTQTRDEQLYSREDSITKYADLLCVCVLGVCVSGCMWQEGSTWWCCSSRGDRELSQSAPPALSGVFLLLWRCVSVSGGLWFVFSGGCFQWNNKIVASVKWLLRRPSPTFSSVFPAKLILTHHSLCLPLPSPPSVSFAVSHSPPPSFLSLSWMSPLLMVAAGIHTHILSQPLADFGWEEEGGGEEERGGFRWGLWERGMPLEAEEESLPVCVHVSAPFPASFRQRPSVSRLLCYLWI